MRKETGNFESARSATEPEAEIAINAVRTIKIMMVPDAGEGWKEHEIEVKDTSEFYKNLPA